MEDNSPLKEAWPGSCEKFVISQGSTVTFFRRGEQVHSHG